MPIAFVTHPQYLAHDAGLGHPERPERLRAVHDGIALAGLGEEVVTIAPRPATRAEVELVHGAQGGWHVWVSMRVAGLDPERVQMELVTEIEGMSGSREPSNVRLDLLPIQDEPGMFRFIGWPAILSRPGCAAGQRVSLAVTLIDGEGRTATDSCVVVPMPAMDDPGACGL